MGLGSSPLAPKGCELLVEATAPMDTWYPFLISVIHDSGIVIYAQEARTPEAAAK